MICRACLRAASRTQAFLSSTIQPPPRFLSTTPTRRNTAAPPPPTPALSTPAVSQPFSAPVAKIPEKKASPLVKSSIPAGQPLKGLNFLKNAQDPVALPDDEYPSWLWTILERQEGEKEGGAAGDLYAKSKKQRRVAAKRLRKEQTLNPGLLEPKIPIYEQTIDLPTGDGSLAGAVRAAEARDELTKAMRDKRRATIKEANFLKAMR